MSVLVSVAFDGLDEMFEFMSAPKVGDKVELHGIEGPLWVKDLFHFPVPAFEPDSGRTPVLRIFLTNARADIVG